MEDTARLAVFEQNAADPVAFNRTLEALIEFTTNILECPHDQERRKVKSDVIKKSLAIEAFAEYLKYIGFEVNGNGVVYPMCKSLNNLRTSQAAMQRKLHFIIGAQDASSIDTTLLIKNNLVQKIKLTPSNILKTKNKFLQKMEDIFNDVLKYEDEDLQQLARQHIPVVTLQMKAIDRMREHQRQLKSGATKGGDMNFELAVLMELLGWFKYSFFEWLDKPGCEQCGAETTHQGTTTMVTRTETCRVEMYKCASCSGGAQFPRHNCPRALLQTRRGRCGEWANCFALLCRALGYDTRYVYDTTDHVWCEVYDYDSRRWLHVDPCEAKIDSPLIYERGWGKALQYVVAFSRDDLQDVTWRYSGHHADLKARRKLCTESELIDAILALREERQKQISDARRRYLARRNIEELVELMVERQPSDYEHEGRMSGSVQWRQQRGELGNDKTHTFEFVEPGDYVINYDAGTDVYTTLRDNTEFGTVKKWHNGVFKLKNMFRKEEKDWKMVYLAREESETLGTISWRVCSKADNLILSSLSISAMTKLYEDGVVTWCLKFDDEEPRTVELGARECSFPGQFKTLVVTASLSGGLGAVAWQHSQLFRTSLTTTPTEPSFAIRLSARRASPTS